MKKKYYENSTLSSVNKKRKINYRPFLWSGVAIIIGAACISLLYFLIYGGFFEIKKIEVVGSKLLSEEEVVRLITPQVIPSYPWRALWAPRNMLFWQFAKINTIARSAVPIFENIAVKLDWINRIVRIEVKERSFFGVWCGVVSGSTTPTTNGATPLGGASGEKCFAFDEEGVMFGRAPLAEGSLLLKMHSLNSSPTLVGGQILPRSEWVQNIFKTISVIKSAGENISNIIIKEYALEEWEADLAGGSRLLFSLNFTPQNLKGLIQNLDKKFDITKLDYIDFRVENRIFYK